MPRSPLPLGTWGKIRSYAAATDSKGKATRWRAVAQYRDYDGVTRQVEARGSTQAKAENGLREKLRARAALARKGELTGMHRFSDAADIWIGKLGEQAKASRRSPGTVDTYTRKLETYVRPAMGELRLAEVTTPLVDMVIGKIKTDVGGPSAKTCRTVISGVMGLAVRYGAVTTNPVREIDRIESPSKRQPRALAADEWVAWMRQLQSDKKAIRRDLPDLTLFMVGTGVRIGEALAVLWHQVDFDTDTVDITHTVIRVTGKGMIRKKTKSASSERPLLLPVSVLSMLRTRFMVGVKLDSPVFPDTLGGFRDPSNTQRDIREARGDGFMSWITSHNFRKTVATALDDAGQSGRKVADQLGHSHPSMTQNVYMARRVANPEAAKLLQKFIGGTDGYQSSDENHG
jgi:integrase